ncbi:hypothetical protein VYU27_010369, partial [Nannochloropsis oceanica]
MDVTLPSVDIQPAKRRGQRGGRGIKRKEDQQERALPQAPNPFYLELIAAAAFQAERRGQWGYLGIGRLLLSLTAPPTVWKHVLDTPLLPLLATRLQELRADRHETKGVDVLQAFRLCKQALISLHLSLSDHHKPVVQALEEDDDMEAEEIGKEAEVERRKKEALGKMEAVVEKGWRDYAPLRGKELHARRQAKTQEKGMKEEVLQSLHALGLSVHTYEAEVGDEGVY